MSFGADQSYIYFKFQFWGDFPQKAVTYSGDLIWDTGVKIERFAFTNEYSKEDSADIGGSVGYTMTAKDGKRVGTDQPTIGLNSMITPKGMDDKMETIFSQMTGAGMVAGGAGFDYIMCAFPLKIFGIHWGDEVKFDLATETGSSLYHHEAIDFILSREGVKSGDQITYKLGSNTYINEEMSDMATGSKKNTSGNDESQSVNTTNMTEEQLQKATEVLSKGFSIDDPPNDFHDFSNETIATGTRGNNPQTYPLTFTDLKSVSIGADSEYIYIKYNLYDIIPKVTPTYGNDFIVALSANFGLNDFLNHDTGQREAGLMQLGVSFVENDEKVYTPEHHDFIPPRIGTSTFGHANSAVKNKDGEDTYGISTGAGMVYGGAGFDYMIAAFPLKTLGLQYGDAITCDISLESGSRIYHHQSLDAVFDIGTEKSGMRITFAIGTNTFTKANPVY